jgi:hypothetical protein
MAKNATIWVMNCHLLPHLIHPLAPMMSVWLLLTLTVLTSQLVQASDTSYISQLQQSLSQTSQSLPQCPDTHQISSTPRIGTPWTCNLSFSSSMSYETCIKEWEERFRAYLEQTKDGLCTLPDFDDRINETELLASDSSASHDYQSTVEGHISSAPCDSSISDISALALEGNLILVEAINGAIYQQLIKRFLQLASLAIQRQQQCQLQTATKTTSSITTNTSKAYVLINTMVKAKEAAKSLSLPPPTNLAEAWHILFQQRQMLAKQRGQGAVIDYPIGEEPNDTPIAPSDTGDPLDPAYAPHASQVSDASHTDTQTYTTQQQQGQ